MSALVNYNERSWAIDLISDINSWLSGRSIAIKRAGGELTIRAKTGSLFPDVLLFGDNSTGRILQGWELKMPDTAINDEEFIKNAKVKAENLKLSSFLLWNVSSAVLYKIEDNHNLTVVKTWDSLNYIKTREEVLLNKDKIAEVLRNILNDINGFITSGVVKDTSVLESLTSQSIFDFLQKNIQQYVSALKDYSEKDSPFNDDVTLWWRYAKLDYPEEKDKFIVLARNNLLFFINKFLFAHILKSYQSEANAIDKLDYTSDIKSVIRTFNNLTERCDFWNIFQTQKGEELITAEVLKDVLDFNELLKVLDFSKVEKTLLHDLIELTVYRNKRKLSGQYTTPPELAALAVKMTIRDKTLPALDPCCGTGTIAKEIYKIKKKHLTPSESLQTTWASDKYSLPLQMAMFNIIDPEAMGHIIRLFKRDATKLFTGDNIVLHEPFSGAIVNLSFPKINYIISNLPFVQQEDLEALNPDVTEINQMIKEKIGEEYVLDGRSDLYAYLPFYFWDILDEDGYLSIIISNSWLGTFWGRKFYKTLICFYDIENITTSGNGRWFSNAKVVTNIVNLKKKQNPTVANASNIIKFSIIRKKITEYSEVNIDEIVSLVHSTNTVDESDISINSFTSEKMDEICNLGLNLNSFFVDNNWLKEIEGKLIKVSDMFNIIRGERRGWDSLFYPEQRNRIEKQYLKPVLKTPRSIDKLLTNSDGLAFSCSKSKEDLLKLGHTGALGWIDKFENATNEKGIPLPTSLRKAGIYWYTMNTKAMAEMVTNINFGDRLFIARFTEPTFINQRLIGFSKKNESVDEELCHALLNSLIGLFYIEAMGIGRGEGALDLTKNKIEDDLRVVNPALITNTSRDEILSKFNSLKERKILSLEDELAQKDSIAFDRAVLKAIGALGYEQKIRQSLLGLYKIRTSVKG